MRSRPRVLYLVYWGAAEPLGQSLVLPAVKRLARLGVDLSLVTFEKPKDLEREGFIGDIRDSLGSTRPACSGYHSATTSAPKCPQPRSISPTVALDRSQPA